MALVSRPALTIEGRTGMPALRIARTLSGQCDRYLQSHHGLFAVEEFRRRPVSLEGQIICPI